MHAVRLVHTVQSKACELYSWTPRSKQHDMTLILIFFMEGKSERIFIADHQVEYIISKVTARFFTRINISYIADKSA